MAMSDIIPFPQSQKKLTRDIKESIHNGHFDHAYELFEDYERQFEPQINASVHAQRTVRESVNANYANAETNDVF